MSILQVVPGLRIAAPRDATRLREQLREAVDVTDTPTLVRYPKGDVCPEVEPVGRVGRADVLRESAERDVLVVAVGAMVPCGLEVADRLAAEGIGLTVVDPRWVKPLDDELIAFADGFRLVVVVEDNGRVGGVGAAVGQALHDAGSSVAVRSFGIPPRFLDHAKRAQVLAQIGLDGQAVAREVLETMSRLGQLAAYEAEPRELRP